MVDLEKKIQYLHLSKELKLLKNKCRAASEAVNKEINAITRAEYESNYSELLAEVDRIESEMADLQPHIFELVELLNHVLNEVVELTGRDGSQQVTVLDRIKHAYANSFDVYGASKMPDSISEAICDLQDRSALYSFVGRLILDESLFETLRSGLRRWLEDNTVGEPITSEEILSILNKKFEMDNSLNESFLMVAIVPAEGNKYAIVKHVKIPDYSQYFSEHGQVNHDSYIDSLDFPESLKEKDTYTRDEIGEILYSFICQCEDCENLTVEILLPESSIEFDADGIFVDYWGGYFLGKKHRIVVRSYDRLSVSYPFKENWEINWDCIRHLGGEELTQAVVSFCDFLQPSPAVAEEVGNESEHYQAQTLGFKAYEPFDKDMLMNFLVRIHQEGIPLAIWPRQSQRIVQSPDCLLGNHTFSELPEVLRQLRDSERKLSDYSCDLSLLWDCPSRPLPPQRQISMESK